MSSACSADQVSKKKVNDLRISDHHSGCMRGMLVAGTKLSAHQMKTVCDSLVKIFTGGDQFEKETEKLFTNKGNSIYIKLYDH